MILSDMSVSSDQHDIKKNKIDSTRLSPLESANPFPIQALHILPLKCVGIPSNHNSPILVSALTSLFHSLGPPAGRMTPSQMGKHSAWCLDFSEARRAASDRRFCSARVLISRSVAWLSIEGNLARPIRKAPGIRNSRTYRPTWILPSYSSTSPNAPDPPLYPWVGDGPSSSDFSLCPSPSSRSHCLHWHSSGCRSGTRNCVSRERTLR